MFICQKKVLCYGNSASADREAGDSCYCDCASSEETVKEKAGLT